MFQKSSKIEFNQQGKQIPSSEGKGSSMQKYAVSRVVPILDTNIYASGDFMGTIQEIKSAFAKAENPISKLVSLAVVDNSNSKAAFDILFFESLPTIASADNAAIDVTDLNIAKCIGYISVAGADYITVDGTGDPNSIATVKNINLELKGTSASTSLWAVLISRGTPTYLAGSLIFNYGFEQCS